MIGIAPAALDLGCRLGLERLEDARIFQQGSAHAVARPEDVALGMALLRKETMDEAEGLRLFDVEDGQDAEAAAAGEVFEERTGVDLVDRSVHDDLVGAGAAGGQDQEEADEHGSHGTGFSFRPRGYLDLPVFSSRMASK